MPKEHPILDALESERIFSIAIVNGKAVFTESCDDYFSHALTPQELDELIAELQDVREQL